MRMSKSLRVELRGGKKRASNELPSMKGLKGSSLTGEAGQHVGRPSKSRSGVSSRSLRAELISTLGLQEPDHYQGSQPSANTRLYLLISRSWGRRALNFTVSSEVRS